MDTSASDIVPIVVGTLISGAVLAFGIFSYRSQYRRADEMLLRWAAQNGYEVIDKQDANPPGTGPKDRYASNKQVMYRVTVRDARGQSKRGVVKLGDRIVGTMKDEVSVEWEPWSQGRRPCAEALALPYAAVTTCAGMYEAPRGSPILRTSQPDLRRCSACWHVRDGDAS